MGEDCSKTEPSMPEREALYTLIRHYSLGMDRVLPLREFCTVGLIGHCHYFCSWNASNAASRAHLFHGTWSAVQRIALEPGIISVCTKRLLKADGLHRLQQVPEPLILTGVSWSCVSGHGSLCVPCAVRYRLREKLHLGLGVVIMVPTAEFHTAF